METSIILVVALTYADHRSLLYQRWLFFIFSKV